MNPDFLFIIGAQRSGSTFLHFCLNTHSEIELVQPVFPEPKTFIKDETKRISQNTYLKQYFKNLSPQTKIVGEKSTSYYEDPAVASRIFNFSQKSKIIIVLRNPVDRAISNYNFSVKNKLENRSPEEVFLEGIPPPSFKDISVSPFDYLKRGEYVSYIDSYMKIFSKEKFKIIFFEKLIKEKDVFNDITAFLNIQDFETSHINRDYILNSSNSNSIISSEILEILYDYYTDYNNLLSDKYSLSLPLNWINRK